jgi:uncharacterized RDD family membrane protein YckC
LEVLLSAHNEITLTKPAYGRFSRRVRAVVVDWIIMVSLMVAALFAAVSANSDHIGRILGFTIVGIWLLYEPLLVSLTGSTIGHYVCNLRVVDDKTHGNINFLKALVRLVIKSVLGILSFITMATTSRHQAMHDLMTRSTVQMRDPSRGRSFDYVAESTELLSPAMPSRIRRILFILVYLVVTYLLYVCVFILLAMSGFISQPCLMDNRCSQPEHIKLAVVGFIYLGTAIFVIIQGWRGRLYGCRVNRKVVSASAA